MSIEQWYVSQNFLHLLQKLSGNVKDMKIGILKEGFTKCDEDVCQMVRSAIEKLDGSVAVLEEVSIQQHSDGK